MAQVQIINCEYPGCDDIAILRVHYEKEEQICLCNTHYEIESDDPIDGFMNLKIGKYYQVGAKRVEVLRQ